MINLLSVFFQRREVNRHVRKFIERDRQNYPGRYTLGDFLRGWSKELSHRRSATDARPSPEPFKAQVPRPWDNLDWPEGPWRELRIQQVRRLARVGFPK